MVTANRMGSALERSHSALGHRLGVSGALASQRSQKRLKPLAPAVEPTRIQDSSMRDRLSGRGDRGRKSMRYDDLELRADEFDADTINEVGLFDLRFAWDCDPDAVVVCEGYDEGLDETDDTGDWQVLALDRFGDRNVNPNY